MMRDVPHLGRCADAVVDEPSGRRHYGLRITLSGCSFQFLTGCADEPGELLGVGLDEVGRVAAELLLRRIASPDGEPENIILPPKLVIRASCGGQLKP